ncbi:MAG TPA: rhomboid family intramembrane serine protease [Acidobacteriaceae bacterium]|jgi:rhomboid protease GluP|nr:rhomboid family intramembrane serine protease [Acidobacteriaceae bacterium]
MTIARQGDGLESTRRPNGEPQILPPAGEDYRSGNGSYRIDPATVLQHEQEPSSSSRILIGWRYAPATYILVGINVAVYGCMVLGGVSWWAPTAGQILHWGANRGANEILQGEWWRLLSATFVHVGIIHIATNMWCLWNLGLLGEPLLGTFGMFGVYALTGITGNLLSSAVNPGIVGAGASGAVFGLAGILIMLLNGPHLPFPREELRRLRRSVIYFAVLNLAIGASTLLYSGGIKIDNMAHLGGFLSGLALGVPLAPVLGTGKERYQRRQRVAFSVLVGGLLLFGYGMVRFWKS